MPSKNRPLHSRQSKYMYRVLQLILWLQVKHRVKSYQFLYLPGKIQMVKYCWDQATQHFLLSFLALHLMSWSQEEWSDLNKQINSYSSTECITMMKSTQTLSIASNTKTVKSNHTILFMHVPDLALVVLCAS